MRAVRSLLILAALILGDASPVPVQAQAATTTIMNGRESIRLQLNADGD